jgi:hypothetical protein
VLANIFLHYALDLWLIRFTKTLVGYLRDAGAPA